MDFFRTKIIAGKIIPAIATTTSLVSACVVIELVKILQVCRRLLYSCCTCSTIVSSNFVSQDADVAVLKNGFINLALPMIQLSEPATPQLREVGNGVKFSEWDRWDVRLGPVVTLDELISHFQTEYGGLDIQVSVKAYPMFIA